MMSSMRSPRGELELRRMRLPGAGALGRRGAQAVTAAAPLTERFADKEPLLQQPPDDVVGRPAAPLRSPRVVDLERSGGSVLTNEREDEVLAGLGQPVIPPPNRADGSAREIRRQQWVARRPL